VRIDIAETIREVLNDKLEVHLAGLGTLRLKHVPVKFGAQRQSLLPPSVRLELYEAQSPGVDLSDYLIAKYDLTKKKAEGCLKKFHEAIITSILNYGRVNINGVGVFNRSRAGQITLVPDVNFIKSFYNGLPEVSARILKDKKKDNDVFIAPPPIVSDLEKKEIPSSIKETVDKAPSPTTVYDLPDDSFPEISNGSEAKEIPQSKIDTPKDKLETPVIKEEPQKTPEKVYPKSQYDYSPGFFKPLVIVLLFLGFLLLLWKGCNAILKLPTNDSKGFITEQYEEGVDPFDNVESNEISKHLIPVKELDALAERPDYCIIITGVFASPRNVESMNAWIERSGYDVYNEAFGPYTRVGFRFKCAKVELETYLQNIRTEFTSRAWYLDPTLYVPYLD